MEITLKSGVVEETTAGVSISTIRTVSSSTESPNQPFGDPVSIPVATVPPAEIAASNSSFPVSGEAGVDVTKRAPIDVEETPSNRTPIPEYVFVYNKSFGGVAAILVESEEALSNLIIDKVADGVTALCKDTKRLYYLGNRMLSGVGVSVLRNRWVRLATGEDSVSFMTEKQVLSLLEQNTEYNRIKWTEISRGIDGLKVEFGDAVSYVNGKFDQTRSLFEQTAKSIQASVDAYQLDVNGTITKQQSMLKVMADEIAARVSKSDFNPILNRMTIAEATILAQAGIINLKASSSVVDELSTKLKSAEVVIDGLKASILLKASSTVVENLETRVGSAEIGLDAMRSSISLIAEKTDSTGYRLAAITISAEDGIRLIGEKIVFSGGKSLPDSVKEQVDAKAAELMARVSSRVELSGPLTVLYDGSFPPKPKEELINIVASEINVTGTMETRRWEFWNVNAWAPISGVYDTLLSVRHDSPMFINDRLRVRYSVGSYTATHEVVKVFHGKNAYTVKIQTDRTTFKNRVGETWLHARVFNGEEDITDTLSEVRFRWSRTGGSDNESWAAANVGKKSVYVNANDLADHYYKYECTVQLD